MVSEPLTPVAETLFRYGVKLRRNAVDSSLFEILPNVKQSDYNQLKKAWQAPLEAKKIFVSKKLTPLI